MKALNIRAYNALIGLIMVVSMAISVSLIRWTSGYFSSWNPFLLTAMYIILSLAGVIIIANRDEPLLSFAGLLLVVAPGGLILSLAIDSTTVINAMVVSTGTAVALALIAFFLDGIFASMDRAIKSAAIVAIIVEGIAILVFKMHFSIKLAIISAIFTILVGYSYGRAQKYPLTVDNAVDSCASIYVDAINKIWRVLNVD